MPTSLKADRMKDTYTSLEELFTMYGTPEDVGGNTPFFLNDPLSVWYIEKGSVEIFSANAANHRPSGHRVHFFSAKTGDILFGMDIEQDTLGIGLLAVGMIGTRLRRFPLEHLRTISRKDVMKRMIAECIDRWLLGLSRGILKDSNTGLSHGFYKDFNPKTDIRLEAGENATLKSGHKVRAKRGIVWINQNGTAMRFNGMEEIEKTPIFPLSPDSYLDTSETISISAIDTLSIMEGDDVWAGLSAFHQLLLRFEAFNRPLETVDEVNRLQGKVRHEKEVAQNALRDLANLLEEQEHRGIDGRAESLARESALFKSCVLIGEAQGIQIKEHPDAIKDGVQPDPLGDIVRASRIRYRKIALRSQWWKLDGNHMLGYLIEGMVPVALLMSSPGKYEIVNPETGDRESVNDETANLLAPFAYSLYRPFPNAALKAFDLIKFGITECKRDVASIFIMGALMSLLGMIVPIATGHIFDSVIPGADRFGIIQMALALFVAAIGNFLFRITRSISLVRFEGKMDAVIQSALWDRLLQLPPSFFRKFSSGDLSSRAMGINTIRSVLSGATITGFLGALFSFSYFFLLLYYSPKLALAALILLVILLGAIAWASYYQIRYQRMILEIHGKITDLALQFITGISKIRIAAAERLAFTVWSRKFSQQRKVDYRARVVSNRLDVFRSGFEILKMVVIYLLVAETVGFDERLTTGDFLAFNAAFLMFMGAMIQVSNAVISSIIIVPIYDRAKPILESLPEVDQTKTDPGELSGEVEFNRVSFRYDKDGPLVLKDVSMHFKPGEFIALVGPSGSGKSTIFRLLLGFEYSESGSILYDRQDLKTLDLQMLRRRIGVVLQTAQLTPGSILDNIIGNSQLTIHDAWEAAALAGIADDIRQMPMGMHTIVSAGGGTFSGGQRQRLMIARAIVRKPRILLFDEATSALDNRTQSIVSHSLEGLQATRIVIAHRLSTIIQADRIYVLVNGHVEQQGSYQELLEQSGPFKEMAQRQLI